MSLCVCVCVCVYGVCMVCVGTCMCARWGGGPRRPRETPLRGLLAEVCRLHRGDRHSGGLWAGWAAVRVGHTQASCNYATARSGRRTGERPITATVTAATAGSAQAGDAAHPCTRGVSGPGAHAPPRHRPGPPSRLARPWPTGARSRLLRTSWGLGTGSLGGRDGALTSQCLRQL